MLVHQHAMFYNLTLSVSKYSSLLAQEWLERHYFNGTKVQWFSLMHGNGCQQAFSCSTTIRALSLVSGWPASYRTESQCCQVSHLRCWHPFPKYQGLVLIPLTVNAHCIFKSLSSLIGTELCAYPWICLCVQPNQLRPREQSDATPLTFVLTLHEDVHIKIS